MNNKIALVTGGLSGIGKGAVIELAKKQYTVIIFGRSDEKAPAVPGYGCSALFLLSGRTWRKDILQTC